MIYRKLTVANVSFVPVGMFSLEVEMNLEVSKTHALCWDKMTCRDRRDDSLKVSLSTIQYLSSIGATVVVEAIVEWLLS